MKENTVRYTAEEIAAMRRRGEDRNDWARIDVMTDEERRAARARDPDAVELPEDWPERVVTGLPEPHQEQVTLRLDPDVLRWFRNQGPDLPDPHQRRPPRLHEGARPPTEVIPLRLPRRPGQALDPGAGHLDPVHAPNSASEPFGSNRCPPGERL